MRVTNNHSIFITIHNVYHSVTMDLSADVRALLYEELHSTLTDN